MLNIQALTAKLASLPDQALQQFASMHKDDPYTLSLAVSESNRRKAMRESQAQAPMDQPPVADQAIAGMAEPVDAGIAAIAPEDVAEFAGGGIVSFAAGGEPKTSGQRMLRDWQRYGEELQQRKLDELAESWPVRLIRGISEIKGGPKITYRNPENYPGNYASERDFADYRGIELPADENERMMARTSPAIAQEGLAAIAQGQAAPQTSPRIDGKGPGVNISKTPSVAPGIAGAPGATGAAPAPRGQSAGLGALSSVDDYLKLLRGGREKDAEELRLMQEGISKQAISGAEQAQAEYEKEVAARGQFGTEREARLKSQEERLAQQESRGGYEALLQAGLAMMAGESPNALVNIGKGAMEGTAAYRKTVADVTAARDRLDESFARLEEARRAEDLQTAAGRREYSSKVREAKLEAQKAMFTLNKSLGYDANKEDQKIAVDMYFRAREGAANRANALAIASMRETGGKTASVQDLSQMRMILSNDINKLREKRDKGAGLEKGEEQLLQQYETDLRSVLNALAERTGVTLSRPDAGGTVMRSTTLPPGFKLD